MSTTRRMILQSLIAGLVAGLVLLGARMPVLAQWGDPEPGPTPSESTAPPTPSTVAPCDLVLQGEAEAVLAATATVVADGTSCTYVADDLSGRGLAVSRTPQLPAEAGGLEAAMAQVAAALQGEVRTVDLGTEAVAVTSPILAQLAVRTSADQVVTITLTAPSGAVDQQIQTMTDLARTALERL